VVGNGKPDGAAYAVTTSSGPVIRAESSDTAIEQRVVPATPVPSRSWVPAAWGIGLVVVAGAAIASRRRREHGTTTN
jgi:hypothetical protein